MRNAKKYVFQIQTFRDALHLLDEGFERKAPVASTAPRTPVPETVSCRHGGRFYDAKSTHCNSSTLAAEVSKWISQGNACHAGIHLVEEALVV
eukprot:1991804-Pleurochrysis_carterae.AAC.1